MGVAPRASQPSVNPLLQQGHDLSSLAHPQAYPYSPAADPHATEPKVPGTTTFSPVCFCKQARQVALAVGPITSGRTSTG